MPADGAAAPDDVDGPPAVPPPVAEVEVLALLERLLDETDPAAPPGHAAGSCPCPWAQPLADGAASPTVAAGPRRPHPLSARPDIHSVRPRRRKPAPCVAVRRRPFPFPIDPTPSAPPAAGPPRPWRWLYPAPPACRCDRQLPVTCVAFSVVPDKHHK